MSSQNPSQRNALTIKLYLVSIALVVLSALIGLVLEATEFMFIIIGASLLLTVFLGVGIYSAKTGKLMAYTGFSESYKTYNSDGTYTSHGNWVTDNLDARMYGAFFGILMIVFTLGAALGSWEIDPYDVPSGVVLFFSGVLALTGALLYKHSPSSPSTSGTIDSAVSHKEIIREKEVIIKVRCSYCQTPFDETLGNCPTCGARR